MPTSYEQEIIRIHQTVGVLEKVGWHEAHALAETIKLAEDALKRASKPGNPPSPYNFTNKELKLFDFCWFFCCNYLAKNRIYKSNRYGIPSESYKPHTKKAGTELLKLLKEVALEPGIIRPTEIKLSQITDHPDLKKIIQLAEQDSEKPLVSITLPGYKITAFNGKKTIATGENQLQIQNPPTKLTLKLDATQK